MIHVLRMFFIFLTIVIFPIFGEENSITIERADIAGLIIDSKDVEKLKISPNLKWTLQENNTIKTNYLKEPVLLKITINNDLKDNVILINALYAGDMHFYDEKLNKIKSFGLFQENNEYFFPFLTGKKGNVYYILRLSHMKLNAELLVIPLEKLKQLNNLHRFFLLFFVGGVSFLMIYHLCYFAVTKKIIYLYYSLFNISYTLIVLSLGNVSVILNNFFYIEQYIVYYSSLSVYLMILFTKNFLDFKTFLSKKSNDIINSLEKVPIIISLSFLIFGYSPILLNILDFFIIFNILIVLYFSLTLVKTNKSALFYIIGWTFNVFCVVYLFSYRYFSDVPSFYYLKYLLLFGCAFEMIINSLGLAYQFKVLNDKKIKAEFEAKDKKRYENATRIITHDVSNPLSVSIMATHLLKMNDQLSSDVVKLINKIETSNNKIKSIIEDTKNYEKQYADFKNGTSKSEQIFIGLKDLFEEKLKEKNIELITNSKKNIDIPIKDSVLINNLLGNFISNSIKFSTSNSKIIVDFYNKNDEICIVIEDHGVGMSEEQINKILNNQLNSTIGTNNEKGTGFGMQIALSLIKEYEGKIAITSNNNPQKGKTGTIFTISFDKKIIS